MKLMNEKAVVPRYYLVKYMKDALVAIPGVSMAIGDFSAAPLSGGSVFAVLSEHYSADDAIKAYMKARGEGHNPTILCQMLISVAMQDDRDAFSRDGHYARLDLTGEYREE